MQVLVIGGLSVVGRPLLRRLEEHGHRVRCLVARVPAEGAGPGMAVEWALGDVRRADSIEAAVLGTEVVVWLTDGGGGRAPTGRGAVDPGLQHVLAACAAHRVSHLIYLSAAGASPQARAPFHRQHWAAEQAVRGAGRPYTIIRPSLIVGPDDEWLTLFSRLVRSTPVLPVPGRARFQPVAVSDLVACLAQAVRLPQPSQEVVELGGLDQLTLAGMLRIVAQALGRRPVLLPVPGAVTGVLGLLFGWTPLRHLVESGQIMGEADQTCNPQPARVLFGVEPRGFRETVLATLHRTPGTSPALAPGSF